MATPVWEPGTLYSPGALVRPRTASPIVQDELLNPSFETGDLTGWTVSNAAITVVNMAGAAFEGTYAVRHPDGLLGTYFIDNDTVVPVTPGMVINAACRYRRETNVTGRQSMALEIRFFDSGMVDLVAEQYTEQASGGVNVWFTVGVAAVAPASAAFAQLRIRSFQTGTGGTHHQYFDSVTWDYAFAAAPDGLVFRATQTTAGYSDSVEPTWPTIVGGTVVDNEVTWEGVLASRVVWEASPILVSGSVEPTWPLTINAVVADGTIGWKAISRRIEDERCPNSEIVAMAASKIFAGDKDIIPYSATVNPLDWSTANDAGYIPFGIQTYGSNDVAALGLYRSNLVAFNSEGFQMWQVDEDPANNAILDAVPVPCTYPKTVQPIGDDLAFLSPVGVRNISVAGASTNLQAGRFGEGIDVLVKAAIDADLYEPFSITWPAAGQYWLVFGAEAFVLTVNGPKDLSWSRYVFPEALTDWTLHGDELHLRTAGNKVWKMDPDALRDDEDGTPVEFEGVLHWPFLDFGSMGVDKELEGLDVTCTAPEGVAVSVGWNQKNRADRTTDHDVDEDTTTGTIIPLPLTAPSFDLRLTFAGNQAWEWNAASIHIV